MILMIDRRLQAKIELVTLVELKVVDRLFRDEDAVRRRGKGGERGLRVAIGEIRVGPDRRADARRFGDIAKLRAGGA